MHKSYLDGPHICVLCGVFVLVQAILCEFAFSEIDAEFDKENHDRLERGDGAVPRPLGDDMFVKKLESCQRLVYADELLGALAGREGQRDEGLSCLHKGADSQSILRLAVRRRRHAGQPCVVSLAVAAAAVDMKAVGAGYGGVGLGGETETERRDDVQASSGDGVFRN